MKSIDRDAASHAAPTHTPGPWEVKTANFITYIKADTGHKEIAVMYAESGVDKKANAHLIAAAPEMKEFILKWIGDGALQTFEDRERFRAEARAVLAKAEAL